MATAILNEPVVAGNPVIPVESLTPILYKDVPVLTTALLSAVYGTTQTRIRENYRANRDRFTEGKHLFKVSGEELRALKECVRNSDSSDLVPKTGGELTLWTERGAARHAKMLNTDKAWDVFELLEENYFNRQQAPAAPALPATLSTSSRLSIQNLIAAKVSHYPSELRPKAFKEAWSRVKNKFQVAKYEEIPQAVYPDVVSYILAMEMKLTLPAGEQPKALPPAFDPERPLYRESRPIQRLAPEKIQQARQALEEIFVRFQGVAFDVRRQVENALAGGPHRAMDLPDVAMARFLRALGYAHDSAWAGWRLMDETLDGIGLLSRMMV
jgi:hypothetical protein